MKYRRYKNVFVVEPELKVQRNVWMLVTQAAFASYSLSLPERTVLYSSFRPTARTPRAAPCTHCWWWCPRGRWRGGTSPRRPWGHSERLGSSSWAKIRCSRRALTFSRLARQSKGDAREEERKYSFGGKGVGGGFIDYHGRREILHLEVSAVLTLALRVQGSCYPLARGSMCIHVCFHISELTFQFSVTQYPRGCGCQTHQSSQASLLF